MGPAAQLCDLTQACPGIFAISKTSQFPSESAVFGLGTVSWTPIIANNHGAILIFRGFFGPDPLPTRVFCRNMA